MARSRATLGVTFCARAILVTVSNATSSEPTFATTPAGKRPRVTLCTEGSPELEQPTMSVLMAAKVTATRRSFIACSTLDEAARPQRGALGRRWRASRSPPDRDARREPQLRPQRPGLPPRRARCSERRRLCSWCEVRVLARGRAAAPEITPLAHDQPQKT